MLKIYTCSAYIYIYIYIYICLDALPEASAKYLRQMYCKIRRILTIFDAFWWYVDVFSYMFTYFDDILMYFEVFWPIFLHILTTCWRYFDVFSRYFYAFWQTLMCFNIFFIINFDMFYAYWLYVYAFWHMVTHFVIHLRILTCFYAFW